MEHITYRLKEKEEEARLQKKKKKLWVNYLLVTSLTQL
jgi:hypothetical protein